MTLEALGVGILICLTVVGAVVAAVRRYRP